MRMRDVDGGEPREEKKKSTYLACHTPGLGAMQSSTSRLDGGARAASIA